MNEHAKEARFAVAAMIIVGCVWTAIARIAYLNGQGEGYRTPSWKTDKCWKEVEAKRDREKFRTQPTIKD